MTVQGFKATLLDEVPPYGLTNELLAMWHDGKGDWEKAHDIAQEIPTRNGSWIHAYLHRKEGDRANAQYWYNRAGKNFPREDLDDEWGNLVENFLIDL